MAITYNEYVGTGDGVNGSTSLFSFTFEYLDTSHIKASINGVNTTDFTLANATQVSFNTPPTSGATVRIFRDTSADNLEATFFPGSAIRAQDLNDNFNQGIYIAQENVVKVDDSKVTIEAALTTATSADGKADTAISTANSADSKADTAITTANTADTNATSAVSTAGTAASNATTALSTASTAETNATNAVSTANSAASTAQSASTTATSADTKADTAISTANSADTKADTAISDAATASTAATAASASATSAQTSASTAATNATAAQASAAAAASNAAAGATLAAELTINNGVIEVQSPFSVESGAKLPVDVSSYQVEGAIRYNSTSDKIELYNGSSWNTAAGGATISASPPSPASSGDVWFDHDNGRAYVYYNDGDSNQWVEMNPSWNGSVADNSVTEVKLAIHNAPSSGKVLSYTSNGLEWTTPVDNQLAYTNDANNRVVTGDGSGGLNGEANLTFDGSTLNVTSDLHVSSQIKNERGTAAAPPYSFTDDTDSGMFNISNADLGFSVGGSERLRIDSSGRVLIGTNTVSPANTYSDNLIVNEAGDAGISIRGTNSNSNYASLYFQDTSATSRGYFESQLGSNGTFTIGHDSGTGPIRFNNGGAERMRLHSTGEVTKPNQPCSFYVSLSNTATSNKTDSTETLVFNTNKRNEGNCYNNSNGRFTAPVAGTYFVGVNILIDESATLASRSCDLQKNGSGYATLCYHRSGGESRYEGMAGTSIIELAANDYISIRGTSGIHTGVETGFIVYLLG